MAKPILATPELKDKEANEFIKQMIKIERAGLTDYQKEMLLEIQKNQTKFVISKEIFKQNCIINVPNPLLLKLSSAQILAIFKAGNELYGTPLYLNFFCKDLLMFDNLILSLQIVI